MKAFLSFSVSMRPDIWHPGPAKPQIDSISFLKMYSCAAKHQRVNSTRNRKDISIPFQTTLPPMSLPERTEKKEGKSLWRLGARLCVLRKVSFFPTSKLAGPSPVGIHVLHWTWLARWGQERANEDLKDCQPRSWTLRLSCSCFPPPWAQRKSPPETPWKWRARLGLIMVVKFWKRALCRQCQPYLFWGDGSEYPILQAVFFPHPFFAELCLWHHIT